VTPDELTRLKVYQNKLRTTQGDVASLNIDEQQDLFTLLLNWLIECDPETL